MTKNEYKKMNGILRTMLKNSFVEESIKDICFLALDYINNNNYDIEKRSNIYFRNPVRTKEVFTKMLSKIAASYSKHGSPMYMTIDKNAFLPFVREISNLYNGFPKNDALLRHIWVELCEMIGIHSFDLEFDYLDDRRNTKKRIRKFFRSLEEILTNEDITQEVKCIVSYFKDNILFDKRYATFSILNQIVVEFNQDEEYFFIKEEDFIVILKDEIVPWNVKETLIKMIFNRNNGIRLYSSYRYSRENRRQKRLS